MNTPASLRSELIAIRSESLIDIAGIAILDRAAVFEVGGDTGSPEGVAADVRRQPGGLGPPLDHRQGVVTVHGALRNFAKAIDRAEEGSLLVLPDAGLVQVSVEISLGVVVRRNVVALAAFFVHEIEMPQNRLPQGFRKLLLFRVGITKLH